MFLCQNLVVPHIYILFSESTWPNQAPIKKTARFCHSLEQVAPIWHGSQEDFAKEGAGNEFPCWVQWDLLPAWRNCILFHFFKCNKYIIQMLPFFPELSWNPIFHKKTSESLTYNFKLFVANVFLFEHRFLPIINRRSGSMGLVWIRRSRQQLHHISQSSPSIWRQTSFLGVWFHIFFLGVFSPRKMWGRWRWTPMFFFAKGVGEPTTNWKLIEWISS